MRLAFAYTVFCTSAIHIPLVTSGPDDVYALTENINYLMIVAIAIKCVLNDNLTIPM